MSIGKDDRDTIRDIIGCAFEVYNELHGGLMESVYEAALAYELRACGLAVAQQQELPIWYKGVNIQRNLRMDLVVNKTIIVELKAIDQIEPLHRKQLFTYLSLTRMPIGLLLNFSNSGKMVFERYSYDPETNRCHAF